MGSVHYLCILTTSDSARKMVYLPDRFSGAHGIFATLAMCDEVSLYGFTTYPTSMRGGDQYAGNKIKMGSGLTWHDWLGEQRSMDALDG